MTTERLIFRAWEENDAADLFALASDPQVGSEAGWPPHKSVEDSLQIIRNVLQTPETYALIRKEDNMLIGCAGLKMGKDSCSGKQDEPEIGYWIGRQFWGKGYATECLNYARRIAIGQNCYKMMLLTGSKSNATLEFYRRAGYNSTDKTAFIHWLE